MPLGGEVFKWFSLLGDVVLWSGAIGSLAIFCLALGCLKCKSPLKEERFHRLLGGAFLLNVLSWSLGFLLILWFHLEIYRHLPLELPGPIIHWLNNKIQALNQGRFYGLPLIPMDSPPRYVLPPWLEREKLYFWFFCFAIASAISHKKLKKVSFDLAVGGVLFACAFIIYFFQNPFHHPLPRFFNEVTPFFQIPMEGFERVGLFMSLYPRMVFYYNAHYMWIHPPLLFTSYALVQMTCLTSCFMFIARDREIESFGYNCAKLAFFLLTVGMLFGYPWALKAWGPNWWWDPKIASSIMMWAVFSTFLHVRLYIKRMGFWHINATLGVLCFVAVVFTFLASYFFPGEHTLQ